jgi:hypothetical protein
MSRLAVSVLLFNQEYVMFDIEKIVIKFCSSVSARLITSSFGISDAELEKQVRKVVKKLIKEGIKVTIGELREYYFKLGYRYADLDFGCDVIYKGDFVFFESYSDDNLAYLPRTPYGDFNKAFRVFASGACDGLGVFILPRRGHKFVVYHYNKRSLDGRTVLIHPDGGFYIGETVLSNRVPYGYGKYIYPNGRVYEGEWGEGGPTDRSELKIYDPAYYRYRYG